MALWYIQSNPPSALLIEETRLKLLLFDTFLLLFQAWSHGCFGLKKFSEGLNCGGLDRFDQLPDLLCKILEIFSETDRLIFLCISFAVVPLDLFKDASQVCFAPHLHTLARGLA